MKENGMYGDGDHEYFPSLAVVSKGKFFKNVKLLTDDP